MTDFTKYVEDNCDEGLATLLKGIAATSAPIRLEMPHRLGSTTSKNQFGDEVQKLDDWANEFLAKKMLETGVVKAVYSEEMEQPMLGDADNEFIVAMDPLDGSSNIKTNNPVGSIFGIYKKELGVGRNQVAALYKLFGPVTTLVLTTGKGVCEFVKLRKGEVKFVMQRENVRLPESLDKAVYGIGGKKSQMPAKLWEYLMTLEDRNFKTRYCGALVADFNQVLYNGGLFAHTQDKLRMSYEVRPMAFICEQAGGASTNGRQSLLDIPGGAHDKSPTYLGSKQLVKEVEEAYKRL